MDIIISTNNAVTTGYPYEKEWYWSPTSHHEKINSNGQRPNVTAKNRKLLENT